MIWFAVLQTGIEGATKLSRAIGKQGNALSKWAAEQPSFEQSELLADAVRVNATWLHNPQSSGAIEPDLFAQWLRSRRLAARSADGRALLGRGAHHVGVGVNPQLVNSMSILDAAEHREEERVLRDLPADSFEELTKPAGVPAKKATPRSQRKQP